MKDRPTSPISNPANLWDTSDMTGEPMCLGCSFMFAHSRRDVATYERPSVRVVVMNPRDGSIDVGELPLC